MAMRKSGRGRPFVDTALDRAARALLHSFVILVLLYILTAILAGFAPPLTARLLVNLARDLERSLLVLDIKAVLLFGLRLLRLFSDYFGAPICPPGLLEKPQHSCRRKRARSPPKQRRSRGGTFNNLFVSAFKRGFNHFNLALTVK